MLVKKITDSSIIREVSYNTNEKELGIEFNTGKRYVYLSVPIMVYQEMIDAESAGTFFSTKIKGKYAYKLIKA